MNTQTQLTYNKSFGNEALDALEDVSADSEDPFSALDMMKQ